MKSNTIKITIITQNTYGHAITQHNQIEPKSRICGLVEKCFRES